MAGGKRATPPAPASNAAVVNLTAVEGVAPLPRQRPLALSDIVVAQRATQAGDACRLPVQWQGTILTDCQNLTAGEDAHET